MEATVWAFGLHRFSLYYDGVQRCLEEATGRINKYLYDQNHTYLYIIRPELSVTINNTGTSLGFKNPSDFSVPYFCTHIQYI